MKGSWQEAFTAGELWIMIAVVVAFAIWFYLIDAGYGVWLG
jgi:hypothetical protein